MNHRVALAVTGILGVISGCGAPSNYYLEAVSVADGGDASAADVRDGGAATPDVIMPDTSACGGCAAWQVCGSAMVCQCAVDHRDCDHIAANGCEADIGHDTSSCGGCGIECRLSHAQSECAGGICALVACDAGRGNCDGSSANGCETTLISSHDDCGECGVACAAGQSCVGGTCVPS